MSTEELKIYLYHVYQLEKQKYMIESTYASLQKEECPWIIQTTSLQKRRICS